MKFNCEIIRDLLPLYCDGVCSAASKKAIDEHLEECKLCKAVCCDLSKDNGISPINAKEEETKVKFIKDVKNKMKIKKIIISVISVAMSVGIIFGIYTLCELPMWGIKYSEDAFTIAEYGENNMVAIKYNGRDYAKFEGIGNITITVDGEEKECYCIRFLESISSKYITSGKYRRPIEDGGDYGFSKNGLDYVYYIEDGWTPDEVVDIDLMREKMLNDGVLIWSKK
ncbi:MAG: zf-HC2 domain-containing protein [Clostridia bacterium]|nr:zf-HC2 domain-containing protein [Clostridia bacterium]